jgi:hypothetical protein
MKTKPTIPEVRDRFVAYHKKHLAWGALHIVLDDGNVENKHVRFCIQSAESEGDTEGLELARILLRMSKTQRLKLGNSSFQNFEES